MGEFSHFKRCLQLLVRLKWLFLSILVIYISLTPGRPMWDALGSSITVEGLWHGFTRVAALAILIMSVNLLVRTAGRDELVHAILWLLYPFKYVGLSVDRLAIRMVLTMEYVGEIQERLIEDQQVKHQQTIKLAMGNIKQVVELRIQQAADKAVSALNRVISDASNRQCLAISAPLQAIPRLYQWSFPLLLFTAYFCL